MADYIRIRVDTTTQQLLVENVNDADQVTNTMAKLPVRGRNIIVELDYGS